MMMNQAICRCCLRENFSKTFNLFEAVESSDPFLGAVGGLGLAHAQLHARNLNGNGSLCEALVACAPKLHIEPDDGLPDVICEECCLRLREFLSFRRICEASERELRRRYADTERAIEEALKMVNLLDAKSPTAAHNCAGVTSARTVAEEDSSFASDLSLLDDLLLGDDTLDGLLDMDSTMTSSERLEEPPVIQELLNKAISELTLPLAKPEADSNIIPSRKVDNIISTHKINKKSQKNHHPPSEIINNSSLSSKSNTPVPKSLHPCPECEKKFTRNFQLKLHLISVHKLGDGLQYKCDECLKTFASRHSLSYHQKSVHSAERPFACSHCDRRFVLRTQLSSHLRVHTGEAKPRIFECLECGKRWPTKSDLRTHMRRHVDALERPFKCSECGKAFFTRGHLSSHLLVHTGEKPFSCTYCDKSYQCVGNLNNHMVRHHSDMVVGGAGRNRAVMLENMEI